MNRTSLIIAALVFALGFAVGYGWFATTGGPAPVSTADIRGIVEEVLDERAADAPMAAMQPMQMADAGAIDPAALHPIIENYLLANPRILEKMSIALDAELRAEDRVRVRNAIAAMQDEIYADPDHVVAGNPNGDVTLIELFDYNCTYCRSSVADILALLDEDPNLRLILKEFPILSEGSIAAAHVGVVVGKNDVDYLEFYTKLFASRGAVDGVTALAAAQELGLDPLDVETQMNEPQIGAAIQRSYALAQALGISGTPTFILGDEIIRGAVGLDVLREKIENMRECGSATCS